jgi:hypothetical protein
MINEVSQAHFKRQMPYVLTNKVDLIEIKGRTVVTRGWEGKEGRWTADS